MKFFQDHINLDVTIFSLLFSLFLLLKLSELFRNLENVFNLLFVNYFNLCLDWLIFWAP